MRAQAAVWQRGGGGGGGVAGAGGVAGLSLRVVPAVAFDEQDEGVARSATGANLIAGLRDGGIAVIETGGRPGLSDIVKTASDIVARNWLTIVGFGAVLLALNQALDVLGGWAGKQVGIGFLPAIVQSVIAYQMLVRLLVAEGFMDESPRPSRFGAYFLASMVYGLAVVGGLLLLIVPGALAATRWYFAPILAIIDKRSATEALNASREATVGLRWTLFWVCLLNLAVLVVLIAGAVGVGLLLDAGDKADAVLTVRGFVAALAGNLFVSMVAIIGNVLMLGAYAADRPAIAGLREIFA